MKTSEDVSYLRITSTKRPAASLYSIIGVRPIGKGGYSSGSMINNFGQIVGHACEESKARTRAFAWSNEHGTIPDLGAVYNGDSFATNINDKGVIVGYTTTEDNRLRAFILGHGQMYDLGLLSPMAFDEAFSIATDINENGRIVGYSHNAENKIHGFYWDHDSGMVDLGSFDESQSYAYSVNDRGAVVGWSQVASKAGFRAFLWTTELGMVDVDPSTDMSTVAYAINNHGVIGGAASSGQLSHLLEAAIWTVYGHRQIGSIGGFPFSGVHALNDMGQAVGWAYPRRHCEMKFGRAFIWDELRGIQDLNYLIDPNSSWMLHKALGINNDGDIVGCGTFDGKMQAFLLSPVNYARDVTGFLEVQHLNLITNQKTGVVYRTIIIKNISHRPISGPLNLIFRDLSPWIKIIGAAGEYDDCQFRTLKLETLGPGVSTSTTIQFSNPNNFLIDYTAECWAGEF